MIVIPLTQDSGSFVYTLYSIFSLMLNNLTPVVRHLIILNVIIFIGLYLLPDYIYNDYFTLYKSNALGIHPSVTAYGEDHLLPAGAEPAQVAQLQREADSDEATRQLVAQRLPSSKDFHPVQLVTHFFNHSKSWIFHIVFNMLVLASLGPVIEMVLGAKRFLRFYLFCGLFAGLMLAYLDPSPSPVVGASTSISGVLVAFAMFFPKQKLQFLFIPVGFEARWFVLALGVLSAVLTLVQYFDPGSGGAISHFGHLAGMIGAMLFFFLEKKLPFLQK